MVPAGPRPSYEEIAAQNAELRALVEVLRAEVAELRRQFGAELAELVAAAVVGLAVCQAGAEVVAEQERAQTGWAAGPSRVDAGAGRRSR